MNKKYTISPQIIIPLSKETREHHGGIWCCNTWEFGNSVGEGFAAASA